MVRFRIGVLLLAIVGTASAACSVHVSENRVLHPAPAGPLTQKEVTHAAPAYTVTRHDIVAPDGAHLYAVHLQQPSARVTILYFGGRKYRIGASAEKTIARFAPLGQDLFIADYRGYGQSEGVPTEGAMAADVLAVYDYAAALPGVGRDRLIVHGHSMGSLAAGYVAAHRPVRGVVLESSVTTADEWVKAMVPAVAKPFIRVKIDDDLKGKGNLENMSLILEPLLILVGAKDKTTPPRLSEALYAASPLSPEVKSLVIVPGADHGSVMAHKDGIAAYKRFLDEVEGGGRLR